MQTAPRKMVAMMILVLQLVCGKKQSEDADADDGEGRMHRRHDEPRMPVPYLHKFPIVRPWRLLLVISAAVR